LKKDGRGEQQEEASWVWDHNWQKEGAKAGQAMEYLAAGPFSRRGCQQEAAFSIQRDKEILFQGPMAQTLLRRKVFACVLCVAMCLL
jgi:hypothetical protein